jgi:hypothetical protein
MNNQRERQKVDFVRKLAEYLAGNQAMKSIELQMGKTHAKEWSALRSTTPLFGYPTVEEAAKELAEWLGSNEPGRDQFDGLKCDFPGCKKVIHAFTGLQELQKLQAHMSRAHRNPMDIHRALDHRAAIEEGKTPSVDRLVREMTPGQHRAAELQLEDAIEQHDAKKGRKVR